jgi:hypothetical protein
MRLYDVPGINSTFIGTIHSMAYNILRNLGYNFKILTDDLDYDLHLELIHKYAQSITEKDYKKYRTQFLSYKLGLISENELMKGISYDSLKELNWMDSDPTDEHPITIKSIAGCAGKKDKALKAPMINAFINDDFILNNKFKENLISGILTAKTNYIPCVDDIVDSYWALKTMLIKEKYI